MFLFYRNICHSFSREEVTKLVLTDAQQNSQNHRYSQSTVTSFQNELWTVVFSQVSLKFQEPERIQKNDIS